jgi:hypothetical protein
MPPAYVIIGCYLVYALYRHFWVDRPINKRQDEILAGQVDMCDRIEWLEDNPSNKMWKKKQHPTVNNDEATDVT